MDSSEQDHETKRAIAEAISLTHHPLLKYNDNTCARCWSAAEAVMVALDLWGAPVGEIRRLRAALEEIATRTTRELAAHSARIARATLDGEDWR